MADGVQLSGVGVQLVPGTTGTATGTVTSLTAGTGIILTPSPITSTGTIAANVGTSGATIPLLSTANTWSAAQTFDLNTAAAPTNAGGSVIQLVGADASVARYEADSFGAIAAFTARRANNTAASPTAIANGDQIGAFNFHGYYTSGGAAYSGPQANLAAMATQNWTSTANGTQVLLRTTANGSTTLATGITIDQDQSVAMAGRATIATSLAIGGATIGSNALAWTGTALGSGLLTITQATANAGIFASTGGSNTGSNTTSAVDLSWTLNTSGSPDVFALRVTDTARGASTKFFNIYGGASGTTSLFSIDRSGVIVVPNGGGLTMGSATITSANLTFASTSAYVQFGSQSYIQNAADGTISLNNNAGTKSVFFTVPVTATFQLGAASAASPVAQTLQTQGSRAGTDNNIGGSNFTVTSGLGTGVGTASSIIFQTPTVTASGTGAQTQTTRLTISATSVALSTATPFSMASGTNQRAGNLTLVSGTQTVNNTTVTANTIVLLTRKTSGGTIGTAITYIVSAGTSFTVNSDVITDTSTFSYALIEVP